MHNSVSAAAPASVPVSVTFVVPPNTNVPSPPLALNVQFPGTKGPVNPTAFNAVNDNATGEQLSLLPPSISEGKITAFPAASN